ncbi:MAG: low molecular weight phosphotyrosine protein phosphatase [Anaerolineae bacterium]|nr:low molecular weight phosphotyrosine protein phosphatase [Anaerolineae bacterium]
MGNICRSPMAEAVFAHMVSEAGLSGQITTDSCGIGNWHEGQTAHTGTLDVLSKHQIPYDGRARQIRAHDLAAEYLIAMDLENVTGIKRLGAAQGEVALLLDYADGIEEMEVPDPYFNGRFDHVYSLVTAGCQGLLDHIRAYHNL